MQVVIIKGETHIITETISASEMIRRMVNDQPIQPTVMVELFNIRIRKFPPMKFDKLFVKT